MSYADAPARAAAWFRSDQSAAGIPPLLAGVGDGSGPFGVVDAYVKRTNQRPHQLYIWRDRSVESRTARQGVKRLEYTMTALILWQQQSNASRADLDAVTLDLAIERVLTRLRGTRTDKTWGGRFWEAGEREVTVAYPDARTVLGPADAALAAGQAYTVTVTFEATDFLTET